MVNNACLIMEDVYTIKIKTKPDRRNLYPSERRYSASTVSGLAWVHIALAATSFLLACLAFVSPTTEVKASTNSYLTGNLDQNKTINGIIQNWNNNDTLLLNEYESGTRNDSENLNREFNGNLTDNGNDVNEISDSNYILVLSPVLITIFGLAAGVASIFASVKWYIDHNITWLFIMSLFSTLASLSAFIMIIAWFITTTDGDITEFYKDKVPFKDFLVIKHTDVIVKNESHMIIALDNLNKTVDKEETSNTFTNRVLSINILIAAFLELLWSLLSMKISYKGMRNRYKEENQRRGNCISVVTKIKGNDTRKTPRNGKILKPKPSLIDPYPSKKIKRIFLAQTDNGYYLKSPQNKTKQNTETSSEIYKERMISFLNRCASEAVSNPEMNSSVHSEALNPIIEITNTDLNVEAKVEEKDRMTPISWGDTPEHTVYNQNTLNLDKIFKLKQNIGNKCENEE